jgi:gamma-glutamyltranspeptidase/glutathione hydrolase
LFRPSIQIAREGFVVSDDLWRYMSTVAPSNAFLSSIPTWAYDFAPNGTLLGIGDLMTRKRYADTLETIALLGSDAFYTGSIAQTTIAAIKSSGGNLTLADLANYNVTLKSPVEVEYRGFKLRSVPAPASGAVVLQTFNVIQGYSERPSTHLNLSTHRLDEAIRFGYGEVRS